MQRDHSPDFSLPPEGRHGLGPSSVEARLEELERDLDERRTSERLSNDVYAAAAPFRSCNLQRVSLKLRRAVVALPAKSRAVTAILTRTF